MRLTAAIIISLFFLSGCGMENRSGCTHKATVVDKSDLDGCKLLFRLDNDQMLEPAQWAVTKPELSAGETYYIDYEEVDMMSICMAGKIVKITCITKAE
ncbi:MAG: hypothetical protein ACNS60_02995 [Candidatus Cyclobacteriaceae bacterium M2_1C_046]